jgi:hypothetical protein
MYSEPQTPHEISHSQTSIKVTILCNVIPHSLVEVYFNVEIPLCFLFTLNKTHYKCQHNYVTKNRHYMFLPAWAIIRYNYTKHKILVYSANEYEQMAQLQHRPRTLECVPVQRQSL